MKLLYIDIETSPVLGYTWGAYEQNLLEIVEDWRLLGFAYAWNEDAVKAVYPKALDQKEWPTKKDLLELELVTKAHALLDEADIVVAHNGDRFDLTKLNAKFAQFGLGPTSPYLSVDTRKSAAKYFKFTRNNLGELGKRLGLGDKIHNSGFDMWMGCMAGDVYAWKEMKDYNIRDVDLLRDVYLALLPFMANHPNMGEEVACTKCGSFDLQKRGTKQMKSGLVRQTYQCNVCGGYSSELKSGKLRP